MDLVIEFKKLKEGQEQILDFLKNSTSKETKLRVYSLNELAKLFGVTKRTIYNWKDEGRLPITIIGSKSYMTEQQLQEFLLKNEVKPIKAGRV
ncbi:MAG: helix-turn-helix domain-containing protein [Methanofastidiosum sp.]